VTKSPTKNAEDPKYVVVTPNGPDDGGDFGRHTTATKTSGLQEAVDFAKANRRDMYIAGGAMPKAFEGGAVYELQETLRIPWMQDFRLDGGEYNLVYPIESGWAIEIDSQMNCRYKFGKIISSSHDGGGVLIAPKTAGPDEFSVVTASRFDLNVIVGAGGPWPGEGVRGVGIGLMLDSSQSAICHCDFTPGEIVGCDTGLLMSGSGVMNNSVDLPFSHINNTHVQIGDPQSEPSGNRVVVGVIDSEGVSGSVGLDIYGQRNLLTAKITKIAETKGVVFRESAEDNVVTTMSLAGGFTNLARKPTNRIKPCQPVGYAVQTPQFPDSGQTLVNREPYDIEITILTPGAVSKWTVTDANDLSQSIVGSLSAGQRLVLSPGNSLEFIYDSAPSWRWRALC